MMLDLDVVRRKLRTAFRRYVVRDPRLLEADRWRRDRGDETLRLDYPLDSSSLVLDLGGYRGDFAAAIHERYGCRVFVFEPVDEFFEFCSSRFAGNPAVSCFHFGLSSEDAEIPIGLSADASSVHRSHGGSTQRIQLRSVVGFLRDARVGVIDLMKVNIEGGEFDVLPAMVASGQIRNVLNLQVQFHDFVPDAVARRAAIRTSLAETHDESWNYEFVWENWRLGRANAFSAQSGGASNG